MYQIRKVTLVPANLAPGDLMTITEAADYLEMSKPGVISAIERGKLTEVLDDKNRYQYTRTRRLVIRSEVVKFKRERGARAALAA